MTKAYGDDLAFIHDAGFGAWARDAARRLLQELAKRRIRDGLIVDLACGSGILAREAAARGFRVFGIDLSASMLALARRHVPDGDFRQGSLWTTPIPACTAVAAVGECFNFLFDPGDKAKRLGKLLRRVHAALMPGGLFLFDIATPGRVPGGRTRQFFEGDGWAVGVEAQERGRMLTRRITSFRKVGELYRRDEETHRLQLLDAGAVEKQLRRIGFKVRRLSGYGTMSYPGDVAFLAQR